MKYIIAFLVSMVVSFNSYAQDFPKNPVKIVSSLPTGIAADTISRRMADVLSAKWGVPVIVENKPGGTGVVALEYYLNQPANGYTIYLTDLGGYTSMPILYKKEDQIAQLDVLTPMYTNYWVIITSADVKNLSDLKTALKRKPFYGSWGAASGGHFCGAEVSRDLKIDAEHVPYKDVSQFVADVVNGTLTFACSSTTSTEQYVKAGKLNWIASTNKTRDSEYPDLPTVKEVMGADFQNNGGALVFFVNNNTPEPIRKKLQSDVKQALQSPEIQASMKAFKIKNWNGTVAEFEQQRVKDFEYSKKMIKQFDIKVK